MKKIFSLLIFTLCALSIWAHDFEVDGIYYNILTDKTNEVEVTYRGAYGDSYTNEYSGSVTIPENVTYNGTTYSVTSIGYSAFADCSGLTSITIPNSVTEIGVFAFENCSSLKSITIPNSVTSIGIYAFYGCSGLTSPVYNAHCFAYMPTSYKGAYIIPEGIKQIAGGAFYNCSSLTSVTIPNSVTSIGEYAFYGCSGLTSITIPNSVTSIGEYAFRDCSGLTSVTIPNSVKSIGGAAFENCSSLKSITIPNSVTSIGSLAFYECSGLTSVTIGNSVTSIGNRAFEGCSRLTSINIPNSVTSIGYDAFYGCSGLPVENNLRYADTYLVEAVNKTLSTYSIKEGTKWIGDDAFQWCSSLTSITIPNSVKSIGGAAFYGCSGLNSITCDATTPPTLGNNAFYYVKSYIPVYVSCGSVSAYRSAGGWKAFTHIQGPVAEYSVAANVNDNKMGAAEVDENTICGAQISATANYGYHFVRWSDGNTDNPRTLVLTQDTTFTAEFAQTYSGQCGDNLYWSYKNSSLTISGFGDMYNNCPWGLFENEIQSVVLPKGITHIGNKAFSNCTGLSEITIPNTVTSIGNYTFYGCSGLTSVTIPNSVTSIGYSAFAYCSSLTSITIPNSVTEIGGYAFAYCSGLTSVTIPNNVTSIGYSAFADCSSLTYVSLSQNVATIEESTFSDCEKLGTVILGSGLKEIEYDAFKGCKKLYDIYCYSPEPPIAVESSFTNYNVNLYVPCESLRDYQMDMLFGSFKYIQCISSEDVSTEDNIVVTPGTNDVTITWPTEDDADTYSIVITKDGEVFCTLTFNSNGQLVSIAFAPGREGNHPAQYAEAAANGYRFTVTGLEEGTKYAYNLDVTDSTDKTIKSYEGVFTTQSTTAVDEIQSTTNNVKKIFLDGQLLIIRDGKTYNAQGAAL